MKVVNFVNAKFLLTGNTNKQMMQLTWVSFKDYKRRTTERRSFSVAVDPKDKIKLLVALRNFAKDTGTSNFLGISNISGKPVITTWPSISVSGKFNEILGVLEKFGKEYGYGIMFRHDKDRFIVV